MNYLFLKVLNFILGLMRKIDYEGEGGFTVHYTDKKKTSGALQKTLSQFSLSAIYLNYFSQGRG